MGFQSPIPPKDADTELSELDHVAQTEQKMATPLSSSHAPDARDAQTEPQATPLGEECAGVASHDHTSSIKSNPESMYGTDHQVQVAQSGGWVPRVERTIPWHTEGSHSPARSDTSEDSMTVNLDEYTSKESKDRGRVGRSNSAAKARSARRHGHARTPMSPAGRAQKIAETHGDPDHSSYHYSRECSLSGDEQGPPNDS
ncbi:uncharacterized protein DNG_02701 [Cephalotrichum gorgonifer]|uniref:Uncharacterized protein n=1 Tax=Cephalotrichum gorgonifer TaxID=2041049 RepID=A0AAE8SSV1_9PEZI|nr:uncharacterized protein DNG_02701 [Cephalotrichum gorgonifer]